MQIENVPAENAANGPDAPRSGACAPFAAPSLDTKCQNPTEGLYQGPQQEIEGLKNPKNRNPKSEVEGPKKPSWDRKQKRAYHKALTCLKYWEANGYQVFFVTLTGAPGSDAEQLSYHHERIKLAVRRGFGFPGLEHFKVITTEGNGVVHALWAIPPAERGMRGQAAYIPQAWLSKEWERVHGARIVDIRRVSLASSSQRRISRYIVSQYCGGQSGFVRSNVTPAKWLGFPLRSTWEHLKRIYRERKHFLGVTFHDLCDAWDSLVRVRSCRLGELQLAIWDRALVEV